MARPQTENGFTAIANELLEAIYKVSLSNYEHRVFWFIVRKTYGYKKKIDWIAQRQIVEETGIYKSHVSRTIKKLLKKNMITKEKKKIGIQKDYELWKLPKQVTFKTIEKLPKQVLEVTNLGNTVTNSGNKSYLNRRTQKKKETITKENIQNKVGYQLSKYLFNKIREYNPKYKKPNFNNWARYIDLMIRIDKRTPEEIKEIIDWCQSDNFWHANILSTNKLREKFDQLLIKRGNKKQTGNWRTT